MDIREYEEVRAEVRRIATEMLSSDWDMIAPERQGDKIDEYVVKIMLLETGGKTLGHIEDKPIPSAPSRNRLSRVQELIQDAMDRVLRVNGLDRDPRPHPKELEIAQFISTQIDSLYANEDRSVDSQTYENNLRKTLDTLVYWVKTVPATPDSGNGPEFEHVNNAVKSILNVFE